MSQARCPNCNQDVTVLNDGTFAEHRTQTQYPLICGLSGDPAPVTQPDEYHEYERAEGYPEQTACVVCGFSSDHPWHDRRKS